MTAVGAVGPVGLLRIRAAEGAGNLADGDQFLLWGEWEIVGSRKGVARWARWREGWRGPDGRVDGGVAAVGELPDGKSEVLQAIQYMCRWAEL